MAFVLQLLQRAVASLQLLVTPNGFATTSDIDSVILCLELVYREFLVKFTTQEELDDMEREASVCVMASL